MSSGGLDGREASFPKSCSKAQLEGRKQTLEFQLLPTYRSTPPKPNSMHMPSLRVLAVALLICLTVAGAETRQLSSTDPAGVHHQTTRVRVSVHSVATETSVQAREDRPYVAPATAANASVQPLATSAAKTLLLSAVVTLFMLANGV